MTKKHQKKQDDKNTIGSVVAGIAGVAAVAGVAIAATMALKDEKSREKVKNVLINAKDQAREYAEKLKTDLNTRKETHATKRLQIR